MSSLDGMLENLRAAITQNDIKRVLEILTMSPDLINCLGIREVKHSLLSNNDSEEIIDFVLDYPHILKSLDNVDLGKFISRAINLENELAAQTDLVSRSKKQLSELLDKTRKLSSD